MIELRYSADEIGELEGVLLNAFRFFVQEVAEGRARPPFTVNWADADDPYGLGTMTVSWQP